MNNPTYRVWAKKNLQRPITDFAGNFLPSIVSLQSYYNQIMASQKNYRETCLKVKVSNGMLQFSFAHSI